MVQFDEFAFVSSILSNRNVIIIIIMTLSMQR